MLTSTLSKSLNYLILYYLILVLWFSLVTGDIAGAMLGIMAFYVIPLLIFIVTYVVAIVFDFREYLKTNKIDIKPIVGSTIKITVSMALMYITNSEIGWAIAKIKGFAY